MSCKSRVPADGIRPPNQQPLMEFHISRAARDRYQFDQALFSLSGNVIFANFHAARVFVQKMNERQDLARYPEQGVRAGQINAMGLIDEIMHVVFRRYHRQENPHALEQALSWLDERLGREAVDEALRQFTDEFPPVAVYRRASSVDEYLAGETAGVPHRQVVLEELITLWLANANPAFSPFQELFDDMALSKQTAYREIMSGLHDFFETQPPFGPDEENLLDMLRAPAVAQPHSLPGQLEYIRQRWGYILGDYLYRLLSSLDFIAEEEKSAFLGPGPSRVYDFSGMGEYERFSPDQAWMPSVVMIAKNIYVWLDQLSKRYERSITRLDQVPDEELDTLARWGFTGLWLIGLWERSEASKRIKQMCGNPEAVASAYSLYDYQIAADLGGDEAYRNLRDRAWRRGIRLASDMVPNHVGIDGKWVIEHPDWFISLDHSPFPAYTFNGPNLSPDERVGIYLEDHYYERSDAAVVFKRVDHWSGDEKYIYHGNDGTSMPWNDTAQLNYLKPEVREAVIQKILDVARQFPIIRFDAAMTLAKKHYQRLWFPEPGSGGDIPSRAEHGMTREQFDAAMPNEFWRQVVDRVAEEAPDTLLLAEAFWLMEGYFVRTLGMHRVYNSAFMNMLRDEDNAKYRSVIKNTLAFDPQILKRYVNFMNNPDERTAVDQFGKEDKYFGICTLLATMPGLPMFGHGQVEGFTEKYGMEYRRAYWDERPDPALVARHEREIFPLLQRRTQFAGVAHFLLYDLFTPEGYVDENVFAYSNQENGQRSLVIYHNKYAETRGWVRTSVAYALKTETETKTETGQGNGKRLVQKSLGEGLGLAGGDRFTIFRDQTSGLEYIRPSWELCEKGLYVELGAYQSHVFLDFREVQDDESRRYGQLTAYLDGRGVPNVEEAMRELFLQPLHHAFRALVNADMFERISEGQPKVAANQRGATEDCSESAGSNQLLDEIEGRLVRLFDEAARAAGREVDAGALARRARRKLAAVLDLARSEAPVCKGLDEPLPLASQSTSAWPTCLGWLFTHNLGQVMDEASGAQISRSWLDEWLLGKILAGTFQDLGMDPGMRQRALLAIKLLVTHQRWFEVQPAAEAWAYRVLTTWLADRDVQQFLQVNRYQDVLWFNQESFNELLGWMGWVMAVQLRADPDRPATAQAQRAHCEILERLQQAAQASEFQVERLLDEVKNG